jgi:tetratricopeptide (TPR) repeat protein
VEGKLDDSGTLEAKIDRRLRGDTEVILRAAFRNTPQPQWKDLVQNISYSSGFAGTVNNPEVSSPEMTDAPFRLSYDYIRKEYPDWKNRRLTMPCPPFGLPVLKDKEDEKRERLTLGAELEFVYQGEVALPSGFTPDLPSAVDLNEDFAEYHSTYAFKDGVLSSERRLTIKTTEIPKEKFEAYRKFAKAANDDEGRYIYLKSGTEAAGATKRNPEADKLFAQAREAFQRRDLHASLDYLKRTIELEPRYPGAWSVIGFVHFQLNQVDEGVQAMRREIEINPQNLLVYKSLGSTLMALKRWEEATTVWQEVGKLDPKDSDVALNVGWGLARLKRYKEAVPPLETAAELNPKGSEVRMELAYAYLNIGEIEKALNVYQKAAELDPRPYTWNVIAYELADKNQKLPVALGYAEKALRAEEIRTERLSLEKLETDDLRVPDLLSHIWDTVGWVHFLMDDLPQAEKYVAAAWSLSQYPAHADHLGQIYEKQRKKLPAIRAYAWAIAASGGDLRGRVRGSATRDASLDYPGIEETRQRLLKLLGNASEFDARLRGAAEELSQMRTITIKPIVSKLVSAEFFVLLSRGAKVEEVKFVSGDESLRKAGDALAAAKFDVHFPDDRPAKILRRGILMCHSISSGCEFVMYPPSSVQSIN